LVVIAVIVLLMALLLPAISASKASARAARCVRQLEQIGNSLAKAGVERVAANPPLWTTQLAPYLDDAGEVLLCPDDVRSTPGGSPGAKTTAPSYGLNSRTRRLSGGDSHKIVALDYNLAVANVVGPNGTDDWPTQAAPRHRGSLHVLHQDGSVQRRQPDDVDPRVCDIHDRLWRPVRDVALVKPGCTNDIALTPAAAPATTSVSTTAGGSTTTGGSSTAATPSTTTTTTTTGSTGTTAGQPCFIQNQGFPEMAGYSMRYSYLAFNSHIPWDINNPRFVVVNQSCNEYELWFEDSTDWDWDLGIRMKRLPDGSIQLGCYFHTYTVVTYEMFDPQGNPVPGLEMFTESGYPDSIGHSGTVKYATNLIPGFTSGQCACPPFVDAGSDRIVLAGSTIQLDGSLSDGSASWTQVSGPAAASFANPAAVNSHVTLGTAGTYVFQLTGTNAAGAHSDQMTVTVNAPVTTPVRYVRARRTTYFPLTLCEVKVLDGAGNNVALGGLATQSTTMAGTTPGRAIDNNTNCSWSGSSCTHTNDGAAEWWMVRLNTPTVIHSIVATNRCDCCSFRLDGVVFEALDDSQNVVWAAEPISNAAPGSVHTFMLQ